MIKARHGRYAPGRREWWKVKHRDTVEVIVGGVLGPITRPEVVIAGPYTADGELVQVGRTVPLSGAQSRELAAMLEPGAGIIRGRTRSVMPAGPRPVRAVCR